MGIQNLGQTSKMELFLKIIWKNFEANTNGAEPRPVLEIK